MTSGPGDYQEVDPAIHVIPLDEPEPGIVGSAKAKKYLLPGHGERASESTEYITPVDVGHAFDVIYRDMKSINKVHVVIDRAARLAMSPKNEDVVVELDSGDWWTWDAGAGAWVSIPAPINDWVFGSTDNPNLDTTNPKIHPQSRLAPGTVYVGSPSGEVWQWDGTAWQDQHVSILGQKGDPGTPGATGDQGTLIPFGDPQNAATITGASASCRRPHARPRHGELHRLDGASWQADSRWSGTSLGRRGNVVRLVDRSYWRGWRCRPCWASAIARRRADREICPARGYRSRGGNWRRGDSAVVHVRHPSRRAGRAGSDRRHRPHRSGWACRSDRNAGTCRAAR